MTKDNPVEFALYKGDEVLGVGTARELSEKFDLPVKKIYWYATPTAKRRLEAAGPGSKMMIAERVIDDEQEDE